MVAAQNKATTLSAEDRIEILDVISRYCFAVDFHDGDAAANDVFTPDGIFEWFQLLPEGEKLRVSARGTDEIRAFGAGQRALSGTPQASRIPNPPGNTGTHVTSNHVIDEVDGRVIHKSYLGSSGMYVDVMEKHDGRWKIKRRKVVTGYDGPIRTLHGPGHD